MAFFEITTALGSFETPIADGNDPVGVYVWRSGMGLPQIQRIGYLWVVEMGGFAQGRQSIVARSPVYLPGIIVPYARPLPAANATLQLRFEFDFAGIPLLVFY